MDYKLDIVNRSSVKRILDAQEEVLIDVIREAYILHDNNESSNPPSYFLKFKEKPKSRIIALPAYLGGKFNIAGLKWIASNPENISNSLPRASSLLILNDYETGFPLACLEGSQISASRTAISAVLAAETINKSKKCCRIGFVGNSLIAKNIYHYFSCYEWQYDEVMLYDLELARSQLMKKYIRTVNPDTKITICKNSEELIRKCDISIFATTAASPYVADAAIIEHKPILLNISLRDLSPELLLASHNIVDDIDHVLRENTSPHLTETECGNRDFINGTLVDLMLQKIDLDDTRATIFSPMGLGILDLALGKFVYQNLDKKDMLTANNFFKAEQE